MVVNKAIIGRGITVRRMLDNMHYHENYNPNILGGPDPDACALARS